MSSEELYSLASAIGCLASQFPCTYLGLPIGSKMSRCCNWELVIDRFQKRLSKWKANSLSFRGRLTLIKSVLGSMGVYYFSTFKAPKKVIHKLEGIRRRFFWGGNTEADKVAWIAWDKALLPRSNGGLGIGSLKASNQSLLAKWWWRFRNEDIAIWCKVIRSIHGDSGGILSPKSHKNLSGTWSQIIKLKDDLSKISINLPMLFKKKIGNGQTTSFWHDNWLGGSTLHEIFMCLYRLELDPNCLVCERSINVPQTNHITVSSPLTISSQYPDVANNSGQFHIPINQNPPHSHNIGPYPSWSWRRAIRSQQEYEEMTDLTNLLIGLHLSTNEDTWEFTPAASRNFTVNCMRKIISSTSINSNSLHTRWNKLLPLKVNILAWRVSNKRLPTRYNLDRRGIDLHSTRCPLCDDNRETEEHLFVKCPVAIDSWKMVFSW